MVTVYKIYFHKKQQTVKTRNLLEKSKVTMSSYTNKTSTTSEQEAMDALAEMAAPTPPMTLKAAKQHFLGSKRPVQAENDEVHNQHKDMGQCHRYLQKGNKDSRCKNKATVQPYQGARGNLAKAVPKDFQEIVCTAFSLTFCNVPSTGPLYG